MTCNVILRRVELTVFAVANQSVLHILCARVCGFSIQHAKCVDRIRLSVVCLAVPYFSTQFHKWQHFRQKKLLNIKFCFALELVFETFLVLRRI